MRDELNTSREQLKAQQESASAEQSKLKNRIQELQARHTEVEHRSSVSPPAWPKRPNAGREPNSRRARSGNAAANWNSTGQSKKSEARVSQELAETQTNSKRGRRVPWPNKRATGEIKELESAQAAIEGKRNELVQALAEETKRREGAEQDRRD